MTQDLPKPRRSSASGDAPVRHRILMLEDHEGSREVMRHMLSLLGHDCHAVSTTSAALCAIDTYVPDVVIYEWYTRSDERTGLGTRFRERAKVCGVMLAVVVLSAVDEPDGFCAREAIDAYLTKPVRPAELEAVLHELAKG